MNIPFRKNIFISFAVLVFSFILSSHVVFAQETVSVWNGDTVFETTAADSIDGNNGTILGGVTIVPGLDWSAFKFNGTSGRINMGNPESLNFGTTGPFTLGVWFNWDGGGESSSINIIRKSNYPVEGPGAGYWLRIGRDSRLLEFFIGETVGLDGDYSRGIISTPIEPNTWYHAVATRDSDGTMKLYVNNRLAIRTTNAPGADTTSEAPFTIGAWDDRFGATEFFSGLISHVVVSKGAIDLGQITPDDAQTLIDVPPEIEKELEPLIKSGQSPGECESFNECLAYCNIEENFSECAEFGDKIGVVPEPSIDTDDVFKAIENGEAPGGCADKVSCRDYCDNMSHLSECISFLEKFDLIPPDELDEMRKIAEANEAGVSFPGNCTTKESCLEYCENSAHQIECMEFALKTGLIPEEDTGAVNKIIPYLKGGGTLPGECTTKESCDVYCESEEHASECIDFALAAGFMTPEEAEVMKKTGGKGPGNCKSKQACDAYCKDETHIDECIDFAVRAGFISQEDAAMAKKFGIMSGGPGNCKSKTECEAFCAVPENQGTCSDWAKEHGMDVQSGASFSGPGGCQSPEECTAYCIEHQKECQNFAPPGGGAGFSGPGGCKNQEECTAYCTANFEDEECKKMMQDFGGQSGGGDQSQIPKGYSSWEEFCKTHDGDSRCGSGNQSQTSSPPGDGSSQPPPSPGDSGSGFSGPGGCKNQEECTAYCMEHQEECQNFAPPSGSGGPSGGGEPIQQPPQNFTGPGGCKTPDECQAYCTQNYQDPACKMSGPGSMIEPANQGFFAGALSTFGPLFGIR